MLLVSEVSASSLDMLLSRPFTSVLAVEPPVTTFRGYHALKPFLERT